MVNGCVRRLKEKSKQCDVLVVRNEETRLAVTNLETSLVPYTGRTKGSSAIYKYNATVKNKLTLNKITILCKEERDNNYGSIRRGSFKQICASVMYKVGVPFEVDFRCIKSCIL